MKRFVETTQEVDFCLTEPSHRAIGGQTCKKKHKNMWRSVINAKNLHQTCTNQEESLIPYPTLGHLLNGPSTFLALSLRQQGTRGICWSTRTTSLNELKLSPWQISGMWMPRNLFGKILSHGSGSFVPSSQTMAFSLIVNLSRDIVVT